MVGAFMFPNRPEIPKKSSLSADVSERSMRMAHAFGLSTREKTVLGYLLEGRSHPYIRDELYISKSTVDTHVRHIYAKTNVRSKQALIDLSKQL
jgi:DNA-binding NarL/FixJ family response regulator